jgi:hypothetical protein
MKKCELSKEEQTERDNWKAEEDARTLMEYQKIFKDEKRLERAKAKLKEREKEAKASLEDINKALK